MKLASIFRAPQLSHPHFLDRRFSPLPTYLAIISLASLVIAALTKYTGTSLGKTALDLTIALGSIGLIAYGKPQRKSLIVHLFILAILIQLASWGYSHIFHPEFAENSPKTNRLAPWFLMIPVAFILGGSTRYALLLITGVIFCALTSPWVSGDGLKEIMRGLKGGRIDFDIKNAQHTSLLFACCLIFASVLGQRFINLPHNWKWLRIVSVPTIVCLLGTGMVITQTRATWIGLSFATITAIAAFVITSKSSIKNSSPQFNKLYIFILISVLTLVIGFLFTQKNFGTRITSSKSLLSFSSISSSNLEKFFPSEEIKPQYLDSHEIRLALWIGSLEWIVEKPLLGWGGKGRKLAIENLTTMVEAQKKHFGHLHNSYLDTAVNYGLIGLVFLLFLHTYLCYIAFKSWQEKKLPTDLLILFYTFMSYWLVVNFFESYLYYSTGTLLFGILGGIILTHHWRPAPNYIGP